MYIPPIPSKKLLGKTETQTTLNRIRFLNEFLKKVASLSHIYYGEEFQVFIRSSDVDVTKSLEKFKREPFDMLLKKYHEAFNDCLSGEKRLADNLERVNAFEQFIKTSRPIVIERRKEARELAEARQAYDDKMGTERFMQVWSLIEFFRRMKRAAWPNGLAETNRNTCLLASTRISNWLPRRTSTNRPGNKILIG